MGILFLLLLLAIPSAQAELYKCLNESGEIQFTDRACEGSGKLFKPKAIMTDFKSVTLITPSKKPNKKKSKNSKPDCPYFTTTELRNLRVKKEYKKGLPKQEISKRYGQATSIKDSGNKWIYKNQTFKLIFKFKHDCLTSWDETWFSKPSKINKYKK